MDIWSILYVIGAIVGIGIVCLFIYMFYVVTSILYFIMYFNGLCLGLDEKSDDDYSHKKDKS